MSKAEALPEIPPYLCSSQAFLKDACVKQENQSPLPMTEYGCRRIKGIEPAGVFACPHRYTTNLKLSASAWIVIALDSGSIRPDLHESFKCCSWAYRWVIYENDDVHIGVKKLTLQRWLFAMGDARSCQHCIKGPISIFTDQVIPVLIS